ncbi:MAG TPA: ABC transporter permease, partial [Chloroflexota bacterium]|nr:ABC transporter permease [Chloroflexota bacterium]
MDVVAHGEVPAGAPAAAVPAPRLGAPSRRARSLTSDAAHRLLRDRAAVAGLGIILLMTALAVFAPLVARQDPLEQALTQRLKPPSASHYFGTDNLGRDVFSRVVYGGRISL